MQTAPSVACPQCGAPAPFRGTAVSLVCEYCGSTVVRTGVDVRLLGRVSALLDNGSPIVLGGRGKHGGVPFEIAGRLQLRHLRGTWNEWYLLFADDTAGWLADAQGSYSITRPGDRRAVARLAGYEDLEVGAWLEVQGTSYMVVEKRAAQYQGAEGVLPFEAEPGLTFYSADLAGAADEFMTLDYGTDDEADGSPVPYVGAAVDLAELELHPLRRFEGWRD